MKLPYVFTEGDPSVSLDYPDPLPPPLSLLSNGRNLRSVHQSDNAVNILHPTQLIPVVVYLMEQSLETPLLREEIELGVKGGKDCLRDFKEAARLEQERWDIERKAMEKAAKSDKTHKEEVMGSYLCDVISRLCFNLFYPESIQEAETQGSCYQP